MLDTRGLNHLHSKLTRLNLARCYSKLGWIVETESVVKDILRDDYEEVAALCMPSYALYSLEYAAQIISKGKILLHPSNGCYYFEMVNRDIWEERDINKWYCSKTKRLDIEKVFLYSESLIAMREAQRYYSLQ